MRSRSWWLAAALLGGCGSLDLVEVPAEVHSERVDHLVIHFTAQNFTESLRVLSERTEVPVSAHYLVPAPGDPTYPRRRLRVHRLVDEERRAWHAGRSYWAGATELNARSIGIEIVNESRCFPVDPALDSTDTDSQRCVFRDYPSEQIELVIELARDILARNPGIDPEDVVGHGDIAFDRRVDPGPGFPWRVLHEHGIGAWPDAAVVASYRARFESEPPSLGTLQTALRAYGYGVDATGVDDAQTRLALRAFQMHFRPADWSGAADAETAAILFALLEKYRPRELGTGD